MKYCALVSEAFDVLIESADVCISLFIFKVLGAQVYSDCGRVYALHVLFDVCNCDVFACFDVWDGC